ncbi:Uncharacterized protein dnm_047570 [Desulfonema magnum]|uniref:Uncharacterized protein n=1 Tax=Desulfonema magnum TaxID=45655 RepID=A0A975GPE4_9BACT|nr:Uncharacterized protein dnm_047570 [Desulfonema magnum]
MKELLTSGTLVTLAHFRHFHINGHDLPVTTNDESFVVFPDI